MSGGGRNGAAHYRSTLPTQEQLDQFKPGDEVDYYIERQKLRGSHSVQAVVIRVTDRRIVIRVRQEHRHRGVHPENLSKRG